MNTTIKKNKAPQRQGLTDGTDGFSMYGDVESLVISVYFPKNSLQNRVVWKFNTHGDVAEMIARNHMEEQIRKEVFFYDENNKLVKKITYDSENLLWGTSKYLYDNRGQISSIHSYGRDGSLSGKTVYDYFCDGKIKQKKEIEYWGINTPLSTQIYEYDHNGNETKHSYYDMDGTLACEHSYVILYDSNNNITERIKVEDGVYNGGWLYKYDSSGNEIEILSYGADKLTTERVVLTYDSNGNLIERVIYNSHNTLIRKITCKYDVYGNMLHEDNDGCMTEFAYNYR